MKLDKILCYKNILLNLKRIIPQKLKNTLKNIPIILPFNKIKILWDIIYVLNIFFTIFDVSYLILF
jgi:hypothetical protein